MDSTSLVIEAHGLTKRFRVADKAPGVAGATKHLIRGRSRQWSSYSPGYQAYTATAASSWVWSCWSEPKPSWA